MLNLESPRWAELTHAYGIASNIPALLRMLEEFPDAAADDEPWFSLWSGLAHQGDVYPASFAAVPHILQIISLFPERAGGTCFQFPAWVEICRQRNEVTVPSDLAPSYFEALGRLPLLIANVAAREWDADFLSSVLAAVAVSKGFPSVAEGVLELTPEVATEFMEWFYSR